LADVRAFPGIRYTAPLERLVSPPYDVIAAEDLSLYQARDPYNVVRLIRPGPDYAGAAVHFQTWLREGVLREDPPSMYLHEVEFDGRRRRDLIAALRLEPYDRGVVLPHERTHPGPKEDRLQLLRATGVALEPLWLLYEGGQDLNGLLAESFAAPATLEFEFDGRHRLWAVSDRGWQVRVAAACAALRLLIADGHHRYETALAYSEEAGGPPDAASRFTPALLTDLAEPGLAVQPTHRLLKSGIAVTGGELQPSLEATLAAIRGRVAAGTYRGGQFQVLPLEGELAVVELHRQVIDNLLGRRNPEHYLSYTRDAEAAVQAVDAGGSVAAFFLDAPDLRLVLRLAREGKTLPQKTTYFHPKPPSGMVFQRLDPGRRL